MCGWPDCTCAVQCRRWEQRFEEGWAGQRHDWLELVGSQDAMRLMLECVARNCPDLRARRHAIAQLMQPAFNRNIALTGGWEAYRHGQG
jgi:hypothetical protein